MIPNLSLSLSFPNDEIKPAINSGGINQISPLDANAYEGEGLKKGEMTSRSLSPSLSLSPSVFIRTNYSGKRKLKAKRETHLGKKFSTSIAKEEIPFFPKRKILRTNEMTKQDFFRVERGHINGLV